MNPKATALLATATPKLQTIFLTDSPDGPRRKIEVSITDKNLRSYCCPATA